MNKITAKFRPIFRSIKRTDLVWRFGSNFRSTVAYRARRDRELSEVQRQVVDGLNKNGIFVTTAGELFGDCTIFSDLQAAVRKLLNSKRAEISALKTQADKPAEIGNKSFNLECLGNTLLFDPESAIARFALDDSFLNISDAYLGMHTRLRYYNVWYTAASASAARESQLWHFDREDHYILKVFLYLEDVDEGAGPFTYARGTHKKGKYRSIEPEFFMEGGVRRSTDDQMNAVFPQKNWLKGIGKKGTLIFADTRGFHKGGEARTKDRLMYTCMFTSHASESQQLIKYSPDLDLSLLGEKQRTALGRLSFPSIT